MNRKYDRFLICDDLISDVSIDKELLLKVKFPEETKGKAISGTFGIFNTNDMPETLKNKMDGADSMEWETVYQQRPIQLDTKPYRCISHSLDFRFGEIIDLELSDSVGGRMIIAKSPYKNRFKKSYRDYNEFLMEWEELE